MKSVEVTLSDGRKIMVHELGSTDLGLFMRSMPAMRLLGNLISGEGEQPTDEQLAMIGAILARMADLSTEEYAKLGLFDAMALLGALNILLPKNFTIPATPSS
jgi:hypothetical protein